MWHRLHGPKPECLTNGFAPHSTKGRVKELMMYHHPLRECVRGISSAYLIEHERLKQYGHSTKSWRSVDNGDEGKSSECPELRFPTACFEECQDGSVEGAWLI